MLDIDKIFIENTVDKFGRPAKGMAVIKTGGVYYPENAIYFQSGPINEVGGRNGAFVEDLLYIAKKRLEFYNANGFSCSENLEAIAGIDKALDALAARTERRISQGTEGTHKGT